MIRGIILSPPSQCNHINDLSSHLLNLSVVIPAEGFLIRDRSAEVM
jgi:hypothetical protein